MEALSRMSQHADQCIARLDQDRLDITQLLAVRHWEWLDGTETGRRIKRFIEVEMCLRRGDVVCEEFHRRVDTVFRERGIVDLAPERRVEAYRKEELFRLYQAAGWPEPHTPYLLQMRPGLFILLSSYQSGFHLVRRMCSDGWYRSREGKMIPLSLLYEGQMEGVPCRVILDCEAYVSHFEGRLSHEELLASVQRVPQAFVRRMARLGAVGTRDVVRVYEKNKCRGEKISFHYTFNILVDPTVCGKRALSKALIEPYVEEWAAWKRTKSMVHTLDAASGRCDPLLHVDVCTVKGKHQFSVVFSRKAGEEPCVIERRLDISDGGETVRALPSAWAKEAHLPTHARALEMLYYAGFTHWTADSITLPKEFRIAPSPAAAEFAPVNDCVWRALPQDLNSRAPRMVAGKKTGCLPLC